jgi:hypothetical protein
MRTAKNRLQFAVQFATLDLDRLREGDWLNLRDDFRDFLAGHRPEGAPLSIDYSEEVVRALQRDVRTLLRQLAGQSTDLNAPLEVRFKLDVFWMRENNQDRKSLLVVNGSFRDRVLWTLSHLIGDAPTDAIRACPECGTLFYRVRKQQYCSPRCVKRVAMRQWRKTEAGKAYERHRSRERYVTQTKGRTLPQVKVGRRPRSRKPTAKA